MTLSKQLTGMLIGMARATDGSDHLITPDSTAVIMECLRAIHAGSEEETIAQLIPKAREAKRRMVPDCFLCANPCGRTSDYDLSDLKLLPSHICQKKMELLRGICQLADTGAQTDFYYKALIVIGMDDFPESRLDAILRELRDLLDRTN